MFKAYYGYYGHKVPSDVLSSLRIFDDLLPVLTELLLNVSNIKTKKKNVIAMIKSDNISGRYFCRLYYFYVSWLLCSQCFGRCTLRTSGD